MRPKSLWIKAFIIMTLLSPRLFGQLNWTWYFSGTVLGTDATGPYIDVTVAVRADSEDDVGGIGVFSVEGYMSESLYDFGEESG
ncbi:MAG TPA: hypothetical protein ENN03_02710, partial [bacterium]|nr:hypothetical protein [bacterium]